MYAIGREIHIPYPNRPTLEQPAGDSLDQRTMEARGAPGEESRDGPSGGLGLAVGPGGGGLSPVQRRAQPARHGPTSLPLRLRDARHLEQRAGKLSHRHGLIRARPHSTADRQPC